jgi:pimeloyl-ACP methyl ester carboxylesterase
VNIPTQIVWGRQDQIVPVECAEMFKNAIPGSKLSIIDNCGHVPDIEKPDEFIKIALDFMA